MCRKIVLYQNKYIIYRETTVYGGNLKKKKNATLSGKRRGPLGKMLIYNTGFNCKQLKKKKKKTIFFYIMNTYFTDFIETCDPGQFLNVYESVTSSQR